MKILSNKKKLLSLVLSLFIFLVFLLFFLKIKAYKEIFIFIKKSKKFYIFTAFILYFFVYILRAVRLKLVENRLPFNFLFSTVCLHTFLNNILPARLGEISIPIIFKTKSINFKSSLKTLFIVRIFDAVALLYFFLISIKFYFFPFILLILFFLYIFKKELLSICILSLGIWAIKFLAFFFIFKSILLKFSYLKVIFITTFPEITTILPIHGLAGFGNFEFSSAYAFSLLKIDYKSGFLYGLYLHLILLCFSFFMFLLGLFIFRRYNF